MYDRGKIRIGFIVGICLIMLCMAPVAGALVISEIMYHPAGENEGLEFIELYNDRATTADVSEFAFVNGIEYTFPENAKIAPKSYAVLARDPNALQSVYDVNNVFGPYLGVLSNGGERLELANANGGIFISFRYNDAFPWPVSADGTGHSIIRSKMAGDPEEGTTWAPSTLIGGTPGAPDQIQVEPEDPTLVALFDVGEPGRYFAGTREPSPGAGGQPSTAWTEVGFDDNPATTSWRDGPSGYGYSNEPDELQYINTQLNMSGNYVSVYARLPFSLTAEQIGSFDQLHARVHYDDGFVLYLNGQRVADSGSISGNPPAFNQTNSGASDPPEANVDLTGYRHLLVSGTNILAFQFHNASLTGSSDCFGAAVLYGTIVPEVDVVDDPFARVVVNELLANSDAGTGSDWIELYNPGPDTVDLSNVYLSDDRQGLLQYKIPDGTVLPSGGFWTVTQGGDAGDLPFALNTRGETVYVTVATDENVPVPIRVMDAVRYGNMVPEVTFGRYPDGAESFDMLSEATAGASNAYPLIGDIVINEIMYHHGTRDERYEYVELYNSSDTDVALAGWAFTDGINFVFTDQHVIPSEGYIVVAQDPNLLEDLYPHLSKGTNLVGPYVGSLNDHSERIRLSRPIGQVDPVTNQPDTFLVTADQVTYYDGGRWSIWADGQGSSLECRDPHKRNDTPDAWAASDESAKAPWERFTFSISSNDNNYSHDRVDVFGMMLLNRGEVLLDDVECLIGGTNRLTNGGFEAGENNWRILGNHVRSYVTTAESHSGVSALHLIATGHGDPGANRINQSITGVNATNVTLRGWARWLRGSRFLLLRTSRELSPTQPPRPAHAFELTMPLNLGTPGLQNTATVDERGPDILDVTHTPVLPTAGEPIVVTARVTDPVGPEAAILFYRSEGTSSFSHAVMTDDGTGSDLIAGDRLYTATIPGTSAGTMRAFYIEAVGTHDATRFPARLSPRAQVPDRTCLVRVGDSLATTHFATYRVWMANDVVSIFRSRANLSNELMDCTFVYNDTEVFYNTRIRFRGSPFLRSGSNRNPTGRNAYRIDFNADQKFRRREEINLDNTEGGNRGPLQERASYWFYRYMGLEYSDQEFIRPILNGNLHGNYEDVQKIDGDYVAQWYPADSNGMIHKIDDYFEYNVDGTRHRNRDEGLIHNSSHPLLAETYRWGFEKRSHREHDDWDHLFHFAVIMNRSSNRSDYEQSIESVIHPEHFARVLALRHVLGDWDSYGYNRGKNNYYYYAEQEGKWYLLPWDIDFTLGSGSGSGSSLYSVGGQFPEVRQFINYPKYRRMYMQALAELVHGPWRTSLGTNDPPTPFDEFLDDAADALISDGLGSGRRDGIRQFVRDRRDYILTQIPSLVFEITTNNGEPFCTSGRSVEIQGRAPVEVAGITVNGSPLPATFSGSNAFTVTVPLSLGENVLTLEGLNGVGDPVDGATDSIRVSRERPCEIARVTPPSVTNNGPVQLTLHGSGFTPGTIPELALTSASEELGFDALYVQSNQAFDRINAATLLLDDPTNGVGDETRAVHLWINLSNQGTQGVFTSNEQTFAAPYNTDRSNYALRLTGYISAPSPGVRYFGVNSDDGFSLHINNQLVGEYANARAPATTDVTGNRTAGAMSFDFPAAGPYYLELDFFENGGGEALEFFQTNSTGGNRRLLNVNSELNVYRDAVVRINAANVTVLNETTLTCQVDLSGAEPGQWNLVMTAGCSACSLSDALQITAP